MENAIEMIDITKAFGDKVIANKNVTMNIRHNEILSLLGENGSGKTTLMNMYQESIIQIVGRFYAMVKK